MVRPTRVLAAVIRNASKADNSNQKHSLPQSYTCLEESYHPYFVDCGRLLSCVSKSRNIIVVFCHVTEEKHLEFFPESVSSNKGSLQHLTRFWLVNPADFTLSSILCTESV
ncbi:hypothetical protein RRG08_015816 [Elysia crispata]|uniref:Uncharacterized protein n=1 Tax=Elysia crispata TaxID=231223 RepID=A0AAE1DRA9_9GAST|nr:hypothetical protein RRG08_015816 [Elysia crispata]